MQTVYLMMQMIHLFRSINRHNKVKMVSRIMVRMLLQAVRKIRLKQSYLHKTMIQNKVTFFNKVNRLYLIMQVVH